MHKSTFESKPVIVIAAWNEEENIGRTIDLINKTGFKGEIIVVNDGSIDRTSRIAREKGCTVLDMNKTFRKPNAFGKGSYKIEFERNVGKTNAVYAGFKLALRKGATAIVTLDADMIAVPRRGLNELITKAFDASKQRKSRVFVSPVIEVSLKGDVLPQEVYDFLMKIADEAEKHEGTLKKETKKQMELRRKKFIDAVKFASRMDLEAKAVIASTILPFVSGIRSFSVPSVHKILCSKLKGVPVGYGFEHFIGFLAKKKVLKLNYLNYSGFRQREAFKERQRDLVPSRYNKRFLGSFDLRRKIQDADVANAQRRLKRFKPKPK